MDVGADALSIIALIEEKACFLALDDVSFVRGTAFEEGHHSPGQLGGERRKEEEEEEEFDGFGFG